MTYFYLPPHVMLSGKVQVARRESKAPYRRRPSVDSNVVVAQFSRVLQMVEAMTYPDCPSLQDPGTLALIRIPGNGHSLSGEKYIMITCPECLRTFPQALGEFICPIHETGCVHCRSLIHFAIVEPVSAGFLAMPTEGMPTPLSVPDLNYWKQEGRPPRWAR